MLRFISIILMKLTGIIHTFTKYSQGSSGLSSHEDFSISFLSYKQFQHYTYISFPLYTFIKEIYPKQSGPLVTIGMYGLKTYPGRGYLE